MMKLERIVQPRQFHLPFVARRAGEQRPPRSSWLRALAAGLAGIGEMRVMPNAFDHERRDPANRNW
jgi:hypothetical protein